jgi:hypothetical protein
MEHGAKSPQSLDDIVPIYPFDAEPMQISLEQGLLHNPVIENRLHNCVLPCLFVSVCGPKVLRDSSSSRLTSPW